MLLSLSAIFFGLILLVWSANRFIEGASVTAKFFGISPLIIGMVIVGFGTSAPELFVSAISALQNNSGIALGNAYGSNIVNIAFILGATALIKPIQVDSQILRKELPILTLITLIAVLQLFDNIITRNDSLILLIIFSIYMIWTIRKSITESNDTYAIEIEKELLQKKIHDKNKAIFWLIAGLILLIVASRILVFGAVAIAKQLGVSDLIIGLTIVAAGTSLPEFASSIIASRKGEHDIAIGNIIGSNLFNTLAVVGIAGCINPINVDKCILERDIIYMSILTLSIFLFGYGFTKKQGRINKLEGIILVFTYVYYIWTIIKTAK